MCCLVARLLASTLTSFWHHSGFDPASFWLQAGIILASFWPLGRSGPLWTSLPAPVHSLLAKFCAPTISGHHSSEEEEEECEEEKKSEACEKNEEEEMEEMEDMEEEMKETKVMLSCDMCTAYWLAGLRLAVDCLACLLLSS